MFSLIQDVKIMEPDYHQVYIDNQKQFNRFNGYRNNCANTVRIFLSLLGSNISKVTAWADTVRNLGKVQYNPSNLQKGDIVAMGQPGDTRHVGVYLGDGKVLHQSAMRGYTVGVFKDLQAFVNHRAGFYFVRPEGLPNKFFDPQFYSAPLFT